MAGDIEIGILVPVRLPSAAAVEDCLVKLVEQLQKDTMARFQIVVGVDSDDPVFYGQETLQDHSGGNHKHCQALATTSSRAVATISKNLLSRFPRLQLVWEELPPTTPFAACGAWNALARAASRAGSSIFLLLGDDVEVVSGTWSQQILDAFSTISTRRGTPFGAGCVGAVEETSPGWPCFPVLHNWHLRTFRDQLFPVARTVEEALHSRRGFYNQDADPFLWELYRRLGLTAWTSTVVLRNRNGGVIGGLVELPHPTRYKLVHVEWRQELLQQSVKRLQAALKLLPYVDVHDQVTIDVVVPCYRVNLVLLRSILGLRTSPALEAQARFVIVVDRPLSEVPDQTLAALRRMERVQRDVRMRCNYTNIGASASRSRGAADCHSEWILFLDDDIKPHPDVLDEYVRAIRNHGGQPDVRGFVGTTHLDCRLRQSTMAFHLAEISCFWHIAEWLENPPWGVTANLMLRWWPGLIFDARFPKTGGGEDIDVCIAARSRRPGDTGKLVAVPKARVEHPWWDDGARWSLWSRVFRWAQGDGMLLSKYPNYTFQSLPNVIEVTGLSLLVMVMLLLNVMRAPAVVAVVLLKCIVIVASCWVGDYVTGWIFCLRGTTLARFSEASTCLKFCACLESSIVRQASDLGRFYSFLRRGELRNMCGRRFDWFLATRPEVIGEARGRGLVFLAVSAILALAICHYL